MHIREMATAFVLLLLAMDVHAQSTTHFIVGGGLANHGELEETGPIVTFRVQKPVKASHILEAGASYFTINPRLGRVHYFIPELQYQISAPSPISPFVGLGGAFLIGLGGSASAETVMALSGSLGIRPELTNRLVGLIEGKLRVNGIYPVTTVTYELTGGIGWRVTR